MDYVPENIHWETFPPRAECEPGWVGGTSPHSLCPLLSLHRSDGRKRDLRRACPCLRQLHGGRQRNSRSAVEGWTIKREQRPGSEYSSKVALLFALHWSPHSVSSLERLHLAVPEVCVPTLWISKGPIRHCTQAMFRKCLLGGRCYARHQGYICEQNQNPCFLFVCSFSKDMLTV